VGDAPAADSQALASDNVHLSGKVPDLVPYLDAADVVVCPFRSGSAFNASVTEALRRGKATVSTAIAARGLPAEARAALMIADQAETFAEAVSSLLADPQRRAELEHAASRAAMSLPRWDDTAGALASVYEELLTGRTAIDRSASDQSGAGIRA
jgi:glycosyltransferase involved in cell wall biosynthesis